MRVDPPHDADEPPKGSRFLLWSLWVIGPLAAGLLAQHVAGAIIAGVFFSACLAAQYRTWPARVAAAVALLLATAVISVAVYFAGCSVILRGL